MLSIDQKTDILRRAGVAVPARPERQMAAQQGGTACGQMADQSLRSWIEQIEGLYTQYALDRATRSLSQAEASLQLGATPHPSKNMRGP